MSNNQFWQDKFVLVTGGNGFVGSHLVKALLKLKAKVIVLDLAPKLSNPILSTSNIQQIQYFQGDISQSQISQKIFSRHAVSCVFHLAAMTLVEAGNILPSKVFEANVMGTVHLLEAVRQQKDCSLVLASSAHVYGQNHVPMHETDFPRPSRPYETSKACADMVAQTYAGHYGLPVAIARFVNIYGPGDTHKRLIPTTIRLLMNNKSPLIYDELVKRDFLFIDDAILAYLTLGQIASKRVNKRTNIIFNFGSGRHYSIRYIIELIMKLLDKQNIKILTAKQILSPDVQKQYLSIKKAEQELDWKSVVSLRQGIKLTIDWYQKNKFLIKN